MASSQPELRGTQGACRATKRANDLVDQMDLVIFPVVIGQGTRRFPDTDLDRALELVKSRATRRGVTIQVYRPAGRLQFATSTALRELRR
jgi:hypothetical protein